MSTEDEVRKASKQFYEALNEMANGDAGALAGVWSHGSAVTAMHPIGGRQVGWDEVGGSFAQVAQLASGGKIALEDQLIRVSGDMAYEVGVERGQIKLGGQQVDIEHRVTNVYQREGGAWKMTHHHTDAAPAMIEALNALQASSGKSGQ